MAANAYPLRYGRYDVMKLLTVKIPPSDSEGGNFIYGIGYCANKVCYARPSLPLAAGALPKFESVCDTIFYLYSRSQTSLHGVQDGRWDWLLRKQSLLRNAHPYRSPRGHFQSLKVSATPFFIYIAVRKQVCTAI